MQYPNWRRFLSVGFVRAVLSSVAATFTTPPHFQIPLIRAFTFAPETKVSMRAFKLLLLWICVAIFAPVASAITPTTAPATAMPANATSSTTTATSTCGPRLRRAWSTLSVNDQTLYKSAVALSMSSGAYIKFVEIHTELMSMNEAHKTCVFIYWHRLFLVAFENMLRAQGPEYACITVPYWDWISDYNRFVNRECTSLLGCSVALQGLGGVTAGTKVSLPINGVSTAGICMTSHPMNSFCHNGNVTGAKCSRCVTRGTWDTKILPASASYASVRSQLFAAKNIAEFSTTIENGVHNSIHAVLDGAMGTFASPADPIFWSHHAMVDLLHTIFHKCLVGEQMMTTAQKAANPVGWTSCKRRDNTTFGAYDGFTMRTGLFGTNPRSATLDPVVGKFFTGLPTQLAALMDHNDLGSSSYVYLYQGLLGEMYTKCGNATATPTTVSPTSAPSPTTVPNSTPTTSAPPPTPTPTTTTKAPTPTPTPSPPTTPTNMPTPTPISTTSTTTPSQTPSTAPTLSPTTTAPKTTTFVTLSAATTTAQSQRHLYEALGMRLPLLKPTQIMVAAVNTTLEKSAQKVDSFTKRTDTLLEARWGPWIDQIEEQEKMACLFQDECLGGVRDYSAAFKKAFNIKSQPRCKQIVDRIRCGHDMMALSYWKETMMKSFGCPYPTTKSATTTT